MNAQVFADWLRQQGHRIIRTENASWYDAGPRVFQAFPYHQVIRPPEEELAAFLRRQGAIALRYSTPLDAPVGRVSYHVVCENRAYDMPALERRARQGVRHGLERCRVEAIPLDRLAREGWQLEAETCQRQGREVPSSEEAWRRRCRVAASLPGFEAWGALVDGRLVASLLAVQIDDCCELLMQQCQTAFLEAHVNNALAFAVTREVSRRPHVNSIFHTLQSLDAPASVDVFKFRMGYVARPLATRALPPVARSGAGPVDGAARASCRRALPPQGPDEGRRHDPVLPRGNEGRCGSDAAAPLRLTGVGRSRPGARLERRGSP